MIKSMSVIKFATKDTMSLAQDAYDIITSDKKNETLASVYASAALAKCALAESIYYSKFEDSNDELESFFYHLHAFVEELLSNVKENHSHQWSLIGFDRLKQKYDVLGF